MKLHWISLQNVPIFQQLQLEEALLRTTTENFCIVNRGSSPAIVMGISGETQKLLHVPLVQEHKIPVIRRFSGGGTVVVDPDTLFITWIFSKENSPAQSFPEPILRWSADFYTAAWQIPNFALRENDYVIGDKKCGGNAQYIQKDRWLHHTSFLSDYQEESMRYLQMPSKRPLYRQDRDHGAFLCRLKEFVKADTLEELLYQEAVKRFYITSFDVSSFTPLEHRRATCLQDL
jgi:lipoate-protein ligase A